MTRLRNYRRPADAATIHAIGALTPIRGRVIIAIFMFRARLRLHHRIVLPVVLVAVVTTTLTAVLALSLIRSALQDRVVSRLRTTATAMRQSDLFLNPAILARLAEVTGTDIVAFGDDGAVVTALLLLTSRLRHLTEVSQPIINGLVVAQGCLQLLDTPASVLNQGETLALRVAAQLNGLTPGDVVVECVLGRLHEDGRLIAEETRHGAETLSERSWAYDSQAWPGIPTAAVASGEVQLDPFGNVTRHRVQDGVEFRYRYTFDEHGNWVGGPAADSEREAAWAEYYEQYGAEGAAPEGAAPAAPAEG